MSNENPGGNTPPSGAPGTPPQTPPAGSSAPPQVVTLEQFNALSARLQGVSDQLGGLNNAVKKIAPPETPPEDKTLKEQFAAFRTERDQERAQLAAERRENAIASAINSVQGIDDEARELLAAHIEQKFGSQIKVEGKKVVYIAPDQSQKAVKDLVADLMTTVGKRFIPATQTNGAVEGGQAANGNKGPHPLAGKTFKEIMAAPGHLRASFAREFPVEMAAKEKEHYGSH